MESLTSHDLGRSDSMRCYEILLDYSNPKLVLQSVILKSLKHRDYDILEKLMFLHINALAVRKAYGHLYSLRLSKLIHVARSTFRASSEPVLDDRRFIVLLLMVSDVSLEDECDCN